MMINLYLLVVLIILTILTPFLIRTYILHLFTKRGIRKEQAWYRFEILAKYVQGPLHIIYLFTSIYLISSLLGSTYRKILLAAGLSEYFLNILFILVMFLFLGGFHFLYLIMSLVFYQKMYIEIRGIEASIKEMFVHTLKSQVYLVIVILITLAVIFFRDAYPQFSNGFLSVFLSILVIFLITTLYPHIVKFMLSAHEMPSSDLKERLLSFLKEHQIVHFTIYQYPSAKRKEANAIVTGQLHKKIFISDFILEKLTKEEVIAVLAHEIGHIKGYHLWIKLSAILLALPLFKFIGPKADLLIAQFPALSVLFNILSIGLFFGYLILVIPFVDRLLERQADRFVVRSGIEPEVFISALKKMATLNTSVMRRNKIEEKFQTHPSYEKRIKWLEEMKKA